MINNYIYKLINSAILAPSVDNIQPWRFRIEKNKLKILLDQNRLIESDKDFLFSLMSLGAAIENIVIEASRHNLEIIIMPENSNYDSIILELKDNKDIKIDTLSLFLDKRLTNRNKFLQSKIPQSIIDNLSNENKFNGCNIKFITDTLEIKNISKLISNAESERLANKNLHEEFFKHLRFSVIETKSSRDGLDVHLLGLSKNTIILLTILKSWKLTKTLNKIGLKYVIKKISQNLVLNTGAIGIISVDKPNKELFLNSGRLMQRIWLKATQLNLSVHPMGALAISYANNYYDNNQILTMILRIGINNNISCLRSLRRPIKDMIDN